VVTQFRTIALVTLLAIFTVSFSQAALAAVSAQLSAQSIDELETVRLTIKVTESRESQSLDLSALDKDFIVLNTNTISQSRFLNGRGQSWVDYQITLQPKTTGNLIIPSIQVGSEATPTMTLRVRALSDDTRQLIDKLVFFETTVSENTVYVQSELVLTRRLYYSQGVQLYSDLPGAPVINNAVVLTLGETKSATIQREGRPYGVVEQQYAIFPERSGSFSLPSISITASVRLTEGGRVSRKGVRVMTDALTIEVLPVPTEYPPGAPWLPATNVSLLDVVNPASDTHQVGDTLTHELLIHMEGNIGTMAPPVPMDIDESEYRIYPQAPQVQDDTAGDTVKGSRLQTHSLIPLQPGSLALPVTEIVWWDTTSKRVRTSSTRPRMLSVLGQPIVDTPTQLEPLQTTEPRNAAVSIDGPDPDRYPTVVGWIVGSILFIAVLLGIVQRKRLQSYYQSKASRRDPLKRSHGQLKQHMKKCLEDADYAALHRLLIHHLEDEYELPGYQALEALGRAAPDTAEALEALQRHLYDQQQPLSAAHQDQLRLMIESLSSAPRREPLPALPALYPQHG